jgi:putative ATPase
MLDGGVDPRYVARRLMRMASEDIGLADPRALRLALDATETYERLGSPEGELALAAGRGLPGGGAEVERCLYGLQERCAPSSSRTAPVPVPLHLRNAPTRLMKDLEYGARLPLCARRGRRLCCRRALLARRCSPPRFYPGAARAGTAHRREARGAASPRRRGEEAG